LDRVSNYLSGTKSNGMNLHSRRNSLSSSGCKSSAECDRCIVDDDVQGTNVDHCVVLEEGIDHDWKDNNSRGNHDRHSIWTCVAW
jgi:hypothetical protein